MKHIWSVLCQKSSIDFETNLLSLFDCIEELSLKIDKNKAPKGDKLVIPIEFQLVSFWVIEDSSKDNILDIKVELLDPDRKSLNHFESNFSIKKGVSRFRNRANIQGLSVTKSGRYSFNVMQKKEGEKDYKIVSEIPIDIKITFKAQEEGMVKGK